MRILALLALALILRVAYCQQTYYITGTITGTIIGTIEPIIGGGDLNDLITAYKERVDIDTGIIIGLNAFTDEVNYLNDNGLLDNVVVYYSKFGGAKFNLGRYQKKWYDYTSGDFDGIQDTSTRQPVIVDFTGYDYDGTDDMIDVSAVVPEIQNATKGTITFGFKTKDISQRLPIFSIGDGDGTVTQRKLWIQGRSGDKLRFNSYGTSTINLNYNFQNTYVNYEPHYVSYSTDDFGNAFYWDALKENGTYATGSSSDNTYIDDLNGIDYVFLGSKEDAGILSSFWDGILTHYCMFDEGLDSAEIVDFHSFLDTNTNAYLTQPILPKNYPILTGQPTKIWNDELCMQYSLKKNQIGVDYSCDIGVDSGTFYYFNPSISDTGTHEFIYSVTHPVTGLILYKDTSNIQVVQGGQGSGSKTILFIGNSTIEGGTPIISTVRDGLTGVTATTVGTRGTAPNNHYGVSGVTYYWMINDAASELNNGTGVGGLDFASYRSDSLGLGSPIDFVVIQLGINDLIGNGVQMYHVGWSNPDKYVRELIDSILADGTTHIILSMSSKGENEGTGWSIGRPTTDPDFFDQKMHKWWHYVTDTYGDFKYNSNVYIADPAINLDRADDYTDNSVHPNSTGYTHMGNVYHSKIEWILKNE